jgi:hypothetical protein
MAKQQGLKKMSDNRQEWMRQHRKGYLWATRRFATEARDFDQDRLFRMCSLVAPVMDDQ